MNSVLGPLAHRSHSLQSLKTNIAEATHLVLAVTEDLCTLNFDDIE